MRSTLALCFLMIAAACGGPVTEEPALPLVSGGSGTPAAGDIHSYARPDQVRVTHMAFDWDVLFDQKAIAGTVLLHLERGPGAGEAPLRLDARDLEIAGVLAGRSGAEKGTAMSETPWRLGEPDPHLGAELVVELPAGADRVLVEYRSRPAATGLQWLDPEQTAGGKHPFLYSQSQAIHARSWIPCQDSPAVRVTFDAVVRVKPPLRAVMAAKHVSGESEAFTFSMKHPIPSYLIALAVGDLEFGAVSPRTGVWTEPSVLDRAVSEFSDMEAMLETTEGLYGSYRWDRYDLLVLPPSFPFGGMENPMLTFATPTILAGDRSLVALVAHELAHSWSGNLVTNATWADFWLNEGFTTYIERRIMENVYGEERAAMEWMLGRQDLSDEIASMAETPGDQVLAIDLRGRDPDDGATNIPYEKGALFLRTLEETYGRERFDKFLRAWFDEHAFTSVTTEQFVDFLNRRLLKEDPPGGSARPDAQAWIHAGGVPEDAPLLESDALAAVDRAVQRWAGGEVPAAGLETGAWSTHQWIRFLRTLPRELSREQMGELDAAFGFTKAGNAEILDEWLVIAVRNDYEPAYDRMERFLTEQGRRKFLAPVYEELVKTDAGRDRARAIYAKARPLYHAISRRTLDETVGWTGEPTGEEDTSP